MKIAFLKKPDKCKWDKDSNHLVIISKSFELCQNITEPVQFPFAEAIAGFIEGLEKAGESVPEEVTPVEMETVTV